MAPRDQEQFSLRWRFVPVMERADRSVSWRWQAWTQSGNLFGASAQSFDTLTECMDDARQNGFLPHP